MKSLLRSLRIAHNIAFSALQTASENWLLGLAARLIFASVLLFFFWNSAFLKVIAPDFSPEAIQAQQMGRLVPTGPLDYLTVEPSAYSVIAPQAVEAVGGDLSKLDLVTTLIVHAGAYGEFILPGLIVLGLFTRIASVGMIIFIGVMTWVDAQRSPEEWNTLLLFDNNADALLMDQRLLWLFLLLYLAIRGAGAISLDYLFGRTR
ncbi:MAG: hypothetical protein AAGM38_08625 [Pseudomonadota bacterium]